MTQNGSCSLFPHLPFLFFSHCDHLIRQNEIKAACYVPEKSQNQDSLWNQEAEWLM